MKWFRRRVHGIISLILVLFFYIFYRIEITSRLYLLITFIIIFLRVLFCRILYHLIILLIILEIFILRIFLIVNIYIYKLSFFFIFCFITLRVAEARIGLSILTMLIRNHGNDYIKIIIF